MRIIKELKYIILLAIIIIVFVSVRSYKRNYFSLSATEAFELSLDSGYILYEIKFAESLVNQLLIDLRSEESYIKSHLDKAENIPFQHILYRLNLKEYKKRNIILYSDDISQSVKARLLLNQMGFTAVYVLDISEKNIENGKITSDSLIFSNEEFKYKFQPDTTIRLE